MNPAGSVVVIGPSSTRSEITSRPRAKPGLEPDSSVSPLGARTFSTGSRHLASSEEGVLGSVIAARTFSMRDGHDANSEEGVLASVLSARTFSTIPDRPDEPGEVPPFAVLAARAFSTRSWFIPEWVGLLALIEDFVATWDDPRLSPKRPADPIYERGGWRCMAPGCTSRQNLEEHHVIYKSRGGSVKDLSNRLCVCRYHHQQGEHGDLATCRGEAPLGIVWRLGRAGIGGRFKNERKVD